MKRRQFTLATAALACLAALAAPAAQAITREEVMTRARAYAYHPWRMATVNETASCNTAYRSVYTPGDYLGLPYDWGGYMSLFDFDQQLAQGKGAGSYPSDGVLACTAGVDCSGFVSSAWAVGHYTTRNLATIASPVATANLLPGDIFNQSGYHVCMFSHRLASGEPVFYESINYNVHVNVSGGWSYVTDYTPLRGTSITGTTATDPLGTVTNPIPITTFPFHDTRDTRQSPSSVLDRCGADTTKNESGPEYVYRVTLTQPGQLTVSVSDDVGVDIDVHLYRSGNTSDCVARHDSTFTRAVDCGTYLVVADTFGAGLTNAGPYNLTVSFAPTTGGTCGAGTTAPFYQFAGGPGQGCSYPGNESLPFCNPNLGADTCLYASTYSYCTHPCATSNDCGDFSGGCCREIAVGERYCMPASRCGGVDAGTTSRLDAGLSGGDPDLDGGVSPPDGGTLVDAGLPAPDGGLQWPDGGLQWPDGGTVVDAGLPGDAGTSTADGGRPRADGGVRDAGATGVNTPPASSGCQSATAGGATGADLAWVGLALGWLMIAARRRSPRGRA